MDLKDIEAGAEQFRARVRHSANRKVGKRVAHEVGTNPDERPKVGRRPMPTPKGWQGYTESAEPTWKVSNPKGVKPNEPKARKAKKQPKAGFEKGATMTIYFVDGEKPNLDRIFDTAKEAHEVAEAFHIRKDVRFIRVVTNRGTAKLYREAGRHVTPKEFMSFTPAERKLISKQDIPEYKRPDSLCKRTVNGANMTGQVVKNSSKGATYGRMQRSQGL
jgi:hypothetical protein